MRRSIFHCAGNTQSITSDKWLKLIEDGGYSAIIFDCDGTLVESSEAHFQAFQASVRTQNQEMVRSWYEDRTGLDRQSILTAFAKTVSGDFDVSLAVNDSIAAFISGRSAVLPIFETVDLVKTLQPSFDLAVVTNSENDVVKASLTEIGLQNYFGHIVSISNGLPPKPAPDMFIAAANYLAASASTTLVFEDSNEGTQAGIAAGMNVIQLSPIYNV
jgi:beta-phosphoglucomutase-like phosphatase (HAD superfamily)